MTPWPEPLGEVAIGALGFRASAIGEGAWVVVSARAKGEIVVLDRSLRELGRMPAPHRRGPSGGGWFATASLKSSKVAWLSWPDLYVGDLGGPLEHVALFGGGDEYTSSNCTFSGDGQRLYFVAPETGTATSCRLRAFDVETSAVVDLGAVPAEEGQYELSVLASGTVVVTVGMATNGGITWRLPAGSPQAVECGSRDWLFQVSESEDRALEGDGDLFLTDWPSGSLRASTPVSGFAIGACFLDDLWAVAFTAGEGAAMVRLDTMEAGPTIPFGEGESWCLAHQQGVALLKTGTDRLIAVDLNLALPRTV